MKLRSSRVLKGEKGKIDSRLENGDAVDETSSYGKSPSVSVSESLLVNKGASEAEDMVCVVNADEDVELGQSNGRKSVVSEGTNDGGNVEDEGLFLGPEVLDPIKDLAASCPGGENEEERVEEGNKLVSKNLSDVDSGLEGETKSPHVMSVDEFHIEDSDPTSPDKEVVDCENGSAYVESGRIVDGITIVNGDEDKKASAAVLDDSLLLNDSGNVDVGTDSTRQKKGKGRRGRKKKIAGTLRQDETNSDADKTEEEIKVMERAEGEDDIAESRECTLRLVKCKRGRKRKNVETSQCNGDDRAKKEKVNKDVVQVSGRVLRSRTTTVGGNVKVIDGRLNGSVVSLKRKTRTECLNQTELQTKVDESTLLTKRRKKKLKRRGRPPKVQIETVSSHVLRKKDESSQPTERPKKKLKRRGRPPKGQGGTMASNENHEVVVPRRGRGRPPKVQGKEMISQGIQKNRQKDMMFKKLKRRGRPPKIQAGNSATHVIKTRKVKRMEVKKSNNQLKAKHVKKGPKIHKMQKEDEVSEVTRDNQQKVKLSEENNEDTMGEDSAGEGIIYEQLEKPNCSGGGADRRKEQRLVRDQIVSILMKAGWTIDHRPRLQREYKDAVYVDPKGRTHWSITKAYSMLKKKIEDGDADSNEVSAFTPIPDEAMNKLFRLITKVRSDKKKRKRRKRGKGVSRAGIFFSGEASPKKKPGKKRKDGSKRKIIWKSGVRFANKSSNVKVRGYKSQRSHGIIAGSSSRGRPKFSQEGNQSRKPCLLARSSEKGSDQDNNGCLIYSGKRNLLSWMIDLGVLFPGGKVQYGKCRRNKRSSEGTITNDGIQCGCCNETMGISNFVAHAGGEPSQSYDNLYLECGTSLRKCILDSWRKEEESDTIRFNHVDVYGDDPNDDTCNICGDGGDLICCDSCPSTFHQSCLDIQNFPSGDWNCIYCSCKFCGVVSISAPQTDDSCDGLISEMLSCCLCEEKFHRLCLQQGDAVNIDSSRPPFCGRKCQEIFERLQTYIGVKFELEDGFSWTLLQRFDVGQELTLHDAPQKVECNSKLAVAFSVMDECFVPIVDERSGISMIHNVVYNCGSNFRRLNHTGFFTAILERDDELISAASIRIHGYRLAEMPFVGTRHVYRRQGMCRRLLDAIESALCSIGVEELVIPAIPELLETWTKVFGFKPLEESKRRAMKSVNMMVFPGTDMLHKPLLKNPSADTTLSQAAVSDDKAVEIITKPNDEEQPVDSPVVAKEAIDYEQLEEAAVLTDGCSYPDENATHPRERTQQNVRILESGSISVVSDEKAVETITKPNDKERPVDSPGVAKEGMDYEQMEEATVLADGCSYPDENATHLRERILESDSIYVVSDDKAVETITKPNDKERPVDSPVMAKEAIDYEQMEEAAVVADGCSYPDEDAPHLETDKSTTSHGANNQCDLNFPVEDVTCQIPEATGLMPPDAKSEIPTQNVASDSDVPSSDELKVVSFVKSERFSSSESSQDCGFQQYSESQLGAENDDGILGVKASPLTSKIVPKNTFDLNLHPSAVDSDMHIIDEDSLPSEPQACANSIELSDSRSQVENNVPHSKPCATPPLLLL